MSRKFVKTLAGKILAAHGKKCDGKCMYLDCEGARVVREEGNVVFVGPIAKIKPATDPYTVADGEWFT